MTTAPKTENDFFSAKSKTKKTFWSNFLAFFLGAGVGI